MAAQASAVVTQTRWRVGVVAVSIRLPQLGAEQVLVVAVGQRERNAVYRQTDKS